MPPSFVPFALFGFSDRMTYIERVTNFLGLVSNWLAMTFLYFPRIENVYRELLHDPNLPSIKEIEANASLVLCNSHISFTKPKPTMPDTIDVGGLHLQSAKPVPKVSHSKIYSMVKMNVTCKKYDMDSHGNSMSGHVTNSGQFGPNLPQIP